MVNEAPIAQVEQLSTAERLQLIAVAWEALSPDKVPVSKEEQSLIDARLSDAEDNPEDQSPWPEVRERLRRQLP